MTSQERSTLRSMSLCQLEALEPRMLLAAVGEALLTISDSTGNSLDRLVSFAQTLVGNTAQTATFTLANTSQQDVAISGLSQAAGLNAGDFSLTVKDDGGNVVAGDSFAIPAATDYTLEVVFTPQAMGTRASNIMFDTDDPANQAVTLNIVGSGIAPRLFVTDDISGVNDCTLDFPETVAGVESAKGTFTIANTGTSPLTISNLDVSGLDMPDFVVQVFSDTAEAVDEDTFTIQPGRSYSIEVTYVPSFAGYILDSITFETDDTTWSSVSLYMDGTSVESPWIAIEDSFGDKYDRDIFFGLQKIGTTSLRQVFTLTNRDWGQLEAELPALELQITNFHVETPDDANDFLVTIKDDQGAVVAGPDFVIPFGKTYSLVVSFHPTDLGDRSTSIVFNTNDVLDETVTLTLSGQSQASALVISDDSGIASDRIISFDDASILEESLPAILTLDNTGEDPIVISSFAKLQQGNPGDFTVVVYDDSGEVVQNDSNFTIPGGVSYTAEITFAPTTVGQRSGRLAFNTSDSQQPFVLVNFSGLSEGESEGFFGTVNGRKGQKLILTDFDGTIVTFSLSGAGSGQVVNLDGERHLIFTNTNAASNVKIATKSNKQAGDDGLFEIQSVNVHGGLGSLAAATTSLLGDFTSDSSVKTLILDNAVNGSTISIGRRARGDIKTKLNLSINEVQDLMLTSLTPIGSLTVDRWYDEDVETVIQAPSIDKLTVTGNDAQAIPGDFYADLILTGELVAPGKPTLGKAVIAGSLAGTDWNITGNMGDVTVSTEAAACTLRSTCNMGNLVFGMLTDMDILAGVNPAAAHCADAPEDFVRRGVIKSLSVVGWRDTPPADLPRLISNSNVSASAIGALSLINGDFAAGQKMIHLLNNEANPSIMPIKSLRYLDTQDPTESYSWSASAMAMPEIIEIL